MEAESFQKLYIQMPIHTILKCSIISDIKADMDYKKLFLYIVTIAYLKIPEEQCINIILCMC